MPGAWVASFRASWAAAPEEVESPYDPRHRPDVHVGTVHIRENALAGELLREKDRHCGPRVGRDRELRADAVIDADGHARHVESVSGLRAHHWHWPVDPERAPPRTQADPRVPRVPRQEVIIRLQARGSGVNVRAPGEDAVALLASRAVHAHQKVR